MDIKNNISFIDVLIGYKRLNKGPLTFDQLFESKADADAFAAGPTSYPGLITSVLTKNEAGEVTAVTAYIVDENSQLKEIGQAPITDYTELTNKPSINDIELTGNKTLEELGITTADQIDTKINEAKSSAVSEANQHADEKVSELDTKVTDLQKNIDDNYSTTEQVDSKINQAISGLGNLFILRGRVDSFDLLPSDASAGDVYLVGLEGSEQLEEYVRTAEGSWEKFGVIDSVDLSDYYKKSEVDSAISTAKQEVTEAAETKAQELADKAKEDAIQEIKNEGYLKEVPVATEDTPGAVKPGVGLAVGADGSLNVTGDATVNSVAWTAVEGAPKINDNSLGAKSDGKSYSNDELGIEGSNIHLDVPKAGEEAQLLTVQLGNGGSLGEFKTGDTIDLSQTTVLDLVKKLLTKRVAPTLIQPSVTLTLSPSSLEYEIGTVLSGVNATIGFNKNDAGASTEFELKVGSDAASYAPTYSAGDASAQSSLDGLEIPSSVNISASVKYGIGDPKADNLGEILNTEGGNYLVDGGNVATNYQVQSGTKSASKTIKGFRNCFYGFNPDELVMNTSAAVRALANKVRTDKMSGSFMVDGAAYDKGFIGTAPAGTKFYAIAIPVSVGEPIAIVVNGANSIGNFAKSVVSVEGADGNAAVDYNVYTTLSAGALETDASFSVVFN